jgi:hypothetical protein
VLSLDTAAADNPRSTCREQSRVLNPPDPTAADFIPVEILCKRAGAGVRNFYILVAQGKAPAPVKGVPRKAALAWLQARGVTNEPPAGELIPAATLCALADIKPMNYYSDVRRNKAPRQIKGVPQGPATAWMNAWASVAAAKERMRAAASQPSIQPEGSA